MDKTVKSIKDKIAQAQNIAIFTHVNCDCDGIGSMLGMYEYLTNNGKNVQMLVDSDVPERFSFLKNYEKINELEADLLEKEAEQIDFGNFDLLISVDTSTLERIGKYSENFKNLDTINIDHHISNSNFGQINYVKPYSSCGEVVYEVLKEVDAEISEDVATCLFSAISSDTNRFSNNNITSTTHKYAGELIDLGANHNLVNTYLHKNKTKEQLKMIAYMTRNIKYYKGVSYLYVRLKDLKKLNVKSSEISIYLNLICNISNTKINLLIKERGNGEYRVSFRSVLGYDVNKVASVFGGGGHINAAGCHFYGNFKKELKKLLNECVKEIEKN